jgi:hypothetical protein
MRRLAALLLAAALLPQAAQAHDKKVLRTVALEPAKDELHVLVSLRVPSGPARAAMFALADRDRNGQLNPKERAALERAMIERAMGGLMLVVGTATRTLDGAESKLSVLDPESPLDLLIHGTAPLPQAAVTVRLKTVESGEPVDVEVLAGDRPLAASSRGRPLKGVLKTVLGSRDELWIRLP